MREIRRKVYLSRVLRPFLAASRWVFQNHGWDVKLRQVWNRYKRSNEFFLEMNSGKDDDLGPDLGISA